MPAVGQGALGLETRKGDAETVEVVKRLNCEASYHRAMAERAMLRTLFAGCLAPVGAFTKVTDSELTLEGVVLSRDGKERIYGCETRPIAESNELGISVAKCLIESGAEKLLKVER